jgi:outer membrane protein TolC
MRRILLLALLAAAGCADVRDARRAQDPASRRPGERTVTAEEAGLGPGTPLILERGVMIALTCKPEVAAARARIDGARASLEQIDAGLLPRLSVSADYRWQRSGGAGTPDPSGSEVGSNSRIIQSFGSSLQFSQLLFDFGATRAQARQAFNNLVAAQSDLVATENDAVFAFKQAFFDVLKQEELVRVGEETVRQFEKRLDQVKGFVEVGTRQKYDLTKAQVDLGTAQLGLVKARAALAVARATLNNALGLASEPAYVLDRPSSRSAWTMSFDEAFDAARRFHPGLQALMLREEAARAAVDAAVADIYPQITFSGSVSVAGSMTPLHWSSFLGPALDWLVYAGGQKRAALRARVAALRESYAGRAREEQRIHLELRRAYAVLDESGESLKIASLTVKQAEENLDLASGRYQAGKASSVELTDAQVALANARAQEIQARYDFEIAVATIERSVGGNRKP